MWAVGRRSRTSRALPTRTCTTEPITCRKRFRVPGPFPIGSRKQHQPSANLSQIFSSRTPLPEVWTNASRLARCWMTILLVRINSRFLQNVFCRMFFYRMWICCSLLGVFSTGQWPGRASGRGLGARPAGRHAVGRLQNCHPEKGHGHAQGPQLA